MIHHVIHDVICLQPEWYMSQVLAWIRDHSSFLEEKIQPLLEVTGVGVDVRVSIIMMIEAATGELYHRLSSSVVCCRKLMISYVMICRHCQTMK